VGTCIYSTEIKEKEGKIYFRWREIRFLEEK
jgi:hypothetical protein